MPSQSKTAKGQLRLQGKSFLDPLCTSESLLETFVQKIARRNRLFFFLLRQIVLGRFYWRLLRHLLHLNWLRGGRQLDRSHFAFLFYPGLTLADINYGEPGTPLKLVRLVIP